MTGFKKGTGSLDLSDEDESNDERESDDAEPEPTMSTNTTTTEREDTAIDMDDLPYLVDRQMRGANVNADRSKQLQLSVRPFVEGVENDLINDLNERVDGPVYRGDVREAALLVAEENPELVAEKLRDWGVEVLDK